MPPPMLCENFLYGFQGRPPGRPRLRLERSPAAAPARPTSGARSAGTKTKVRGPKRKEVSRAAADLTREPAQRLSSG
jgi:hypothetical protein